MRRIFGLIISIVSAAAFLAVPAHADVDNFTIESYDAIFKLSRDEEQHAVLNVQLTIQANFPPNQNHGLAPIFVKDYDGHRTDFKLISVTDQKGNPLEYNWDANALQIGDPSTYIEGKKTYVINYSQKYVTKYYKDTDKDEFYWDVIGNEWRVPIKNAAVVLEIDEKLRDQVASKGQCYVGKQGSTARCEAATDMLKQGNYIIYQQNLAPKHGITIAVGFKPGTFKQYEKTWQEKYHDYWVTAQVVTLPFGFFAAVWCWAWIISKRYRTKELGTIVPEYTPPKDVSLLTIASILYSSGNKAAYRGPAALLDFAVRNIIKIYEVRPKGMLSGAKYEIEIVQPIDNLLPEEQEFLNDLFDGKVKTGTRFSMDSLINSGYYFRIKDDDEHIEKLALENYGLLELDPETDRKARKSAKYFWLLALSGMSLAFVVIAFFAQFSNIPSKRLTDKGLRLSRYMEGLRMYIKVAEIERLKMLQSPTGAEKVAEAGFGNVGDERQLIKLYEKTLPYAVLFKQEQEWVKALGNFYEKLGEQPTWFVGASAFSAAAFASSVDSMTSASSSISGVGGSSGGGSSGGGGGGGGGGGF